MIFCSTKSKKAAAVWQVITCLFPILWSNMTWRERWMWSLGICHFASSPSCFRAFFCPYWTWVEDEARKMKHARWSTEDEVYGKVRVNRITELKFKNPTAQHPEQVNRVCIVSVNWETACHCSKTQGGHHFCRPTPVFSLLVLTCRDFQEQKSWCFFFFWWGTLKSQKEEHSSRTTFKCPAAYADCLNKKEKWMKMRKSFSQMYFRTII